MTHTKIKNVCDFCNREYVNIDIAQKHEKMCYRNPSRRACATCRFWERDFEERHFLEGGYDVTRDVWESWCEAGVESDAAGLELKHDCELWQAKGGSQED